MNRTRSTLIATACAALLALCGASMAQGTAAADGAPQPAATQQAQPRHQGERAERRHARMGPEQREQMRARRAEAFKQKLALTPAQQPAWEAFLQAMQPGERHARLDARAMDQLSTPERIDRMRAIRAQRAAEMDRRGDAIKAFYAELNAEQQKTFDAEGLRMFSRFGHGKRGHHGPHPQGPGQGHAAPAGGDGATATR
ncbi:Spy/CpxP family protein refolding chaperone [Melaminivora alkalimesophila]|uniref:LTXXQ motif family protein n=1 Tax=Melaminivora alkalimesophila TaxID=1165852 RepID=A0A317RBQ1_9BURK|nr:Spy/CpxP family protein refolding chaperone [Melaminivora alkalimesophila]PWW46922.1 LTXXQ motif family protein [Melaminivora alkalimesophila]